MYLGIDIGKTGAIGVVDEDGGYIDVEDLPIEVLEVGNKKKAGWRLDAKGFVNIFASLNIHTVTIEALWANSTNGALAGFSMGRLLGSVEVLLQGCVQAPQYYVAPLRWKRHFNLIGQDKSASLGLARELFPEAPLSRKKDHNRAESLLLAYYGWQTRKETI